MKIKHLLFGALVLPVAFTACTSEEFEPTQVPSNNEAALKGRAKGVVTLSVEKANVEDEASTRVNGIQNGNGVNWRWMSSEDKLGGVVVDYKPDGSIVDKDYLGPNKYVITNYPFAPMIDAPSTYADFRTPTAVVEGAYMFYSQYNGANVRRGNISHSISRLQIVNEGWEKGLEQVGSDAQLRGQNFFVSPIVDLAVKDGAEGAENKNPLTLTSAHALLHITLKSDVEAKYYEGDGFQINKIVLRTMGASDKFHLGQTINPKAIDELQKSVYNELKAAGHSAQKAFNTGVNYSIKADHSKAREAMGYVLNKIQGKNIWTGVEDPSANVSGISVYDGTASTDLVYQLETPYSFTSKADEFNLLVILPEGVYSKGSYSPAVEYNGKTEGVWRMTVYTSEGTYDEYIGENVIKAHRGKKLNIPNRVLKIKGGETNINLFDPNEAFNIETTADYNYVIDYINNHYRDFGNASDWKAPVLNFVAGKTINVDEAHLFPEFPVRYIGNATLNLTAENHEYKFNPYNVILAAGTGTDRPTIKIDDAGSSIAFTHNIMDDGKTTDGKDMTHALKLNAKAKVIVANNQTVNFETLTSGTDMSVGESATVKVSGAASASGLLNVEKNAYVEFSSNATLNGKVFVKENADILAKGQFTNTSEMKVDPLASVTLEQNAINRGTITLEGTAELYSETDFTNYGTLLVKKCENEMNKKTRAKAEFVKLTNNGTITLEASVDKKGTYGAYVNVAGELINNKNAKVNNNGELNIKTVKNSGTITLESDPYALISVDNGYYTDDKGFGSVVLADATEYEMYDNYYTGRNKLTGPGGIAIDGVVETTIEKQETYNKILANYTDSKMSSQENALEVLNKITVKCNLTVMNAELENVDFILAENSALVAGQNDLVINSLTANKKSSLSTDADDWNKWNVTIKKEVVTNADFEVTNKVNAIINSGYEYGTENYGSLNIKAGTFTNNGSIVGTADNKPVYTYIERNATLKNKGSIGQTTGSTLNHYIIIRANKGTIDMKDSNKTVGGIVDNTQGIKIGEFDVNVLESEHASIVGGIIGI